MVGTGVSEPGMPIGPVGAGTETEGTPVGLGMSCSPVSVGHIVVEPVMVTVGTTGLVCLGGVYVLVVGLQGTTVVKVSVMVCTGFLVLDEVVGSAVCVAGQTMTEEMMVEVTIFWVSEAGQLGTEAWQLVIV